MADQCWKKTWGQTINYFLNDKTNFGVSSNDKWIYIIGLTHGRMSDWWFQSFFIVHNIWDNPSH